MKLRAVGRLLRLSLAPSAAADAAAGLVLGSGGGFGSGPTTAGPWLLIASSLAIYTGALALNDWADREHDGRTRPDRPIPSGAVSPAFALGLAACLLLGGIACAFAADARAGWFMLGVAVLAGLYDVVLRGPWLGPLALGLCRAGNLGAGLLLGSAAVRGDASVPPGLLLPAVVYGLYVFLASRLGRMEDAEDELSGARARRLVATCAVMFPVAALVCQLPLGGLPGPGLPYELPLALGAAYGLLQPARRREWSLVDVQRTMGLLLRRLLIFSAVFALAALRFEGGPTPVVAALAILAGYPLAHQLRRVFPPS